MAEFDAAAAAPQQRVPDIEVARLIGRALVNAARTLGVDYRNMRLQQLCDQTIKAAQGGGLDVDSYRLAWMMRRMGQDR
jgi:hypothetical protein